MFGLLVIGAALLIVAIDCFVDPWLVERRARREWLARRRAGS